MKHNTIRIWILTALIGSILFGFLLKIDGSIHHSRFSLDGGQIVMVSGIAVVACLILLIPATIIFHFLAIRLFERWNNTLKIKTVLALYALVSVFASVFIVSVGTGGYVNDALAILTSPYAISFSVASCFFSYRSSHQNLEQNHSANSFPKHNFQKSPNEKHF
ncbi:hypothetical protein [Taibaiella soli]|uniref:Uncharacterized protein n=1 Tax=Taibaiella soli TaxID=1649169 RepID=A0A2W2B4K8_9BACT|nr:hypothetical protein [Taibaiella soli]PZF71077.1 hypothetical protein DN068_20480 [Taibaiella soli]